MARRRRWLKILGGSTAVLLVAVLAVLLWGRSRLTCSLAALDGEIAVAGLDAPVTIERDALGIPTIRASERSDRAFAVGFLHGQERFFQIDLMRRQAAGELAALLGTGVVDADRAARLHRLRDLSHRVVERATPEQRKTLEAYVAGVNAGLAALDGPPFEYLLLRSEPEPWVAEDSVLCMLSMFFTLQDSDGSREIARGRIEDALGPELAAFLVPDGDRWDAPLTGEAVVPPPLPNLDGLPLLDATAVFVPEALGVVLGSNSFAVAGSLTDDGRALLANDTHLPLSVPIIWYRATFDDGDRRVSGITYPGLPSTVIGSNGTLAWGFTNSYGDWVDVIELELDGDDPDRYRIPGGSEPFERFEETIEVQGGGDVRLDLRFSRWGPVLEEEDGRLLAIRWVAHHPEALDLAAFELEDADSLDRALDVLNRAGLPAVNALLADDAGSIAWTIGGRIPRRRLTPRRPIRWDTPEMEWSGWLDPEEYPRIVDPASGRLWTANNRIVDGAALTVLGDGGYALGARARQIRDGLMKRDRFDERTLLEIQLDDRALFLAHWRGHLLDLLDDEAVAGSPQRAELKRLVGDDWSGRASVESAGFRLVRGYRSFLFQRIVGGIVGDAGYPYSGRWEHPLWTIVEERPQALLPDGFDSWDAWLLDVVDETIAYFTEDGAELASRTWGQRNTTRIRHPVSLSVPQLSGFLDMPAMELPGDRDMPRFQSPSAGASQRMVVAPGREDEGIFHMAGGQSGHPLSPFYRTGFNDWAEGSPSTLLPGETVHTLTLVPR